jgi:hypothetical protein
VPDGSWFVLDGVAYVLERFLHVPSYCGCGELCLRGLTVWLLEEITGTNHLVQHPIQRDDQPTQPVLLLLS